MYLPTYLHTLPLEDCTDYVPQVSSAPHLLRCCLLILKEECSEERERSGGSLVLLHLIIISQSFEACTPSFLVPSLASLYITVRQRLLPSGCPAVLMTSRRRSALSPALSSFQLQITPSCYIPRSSVQLAVRGHLLSYPYLRPCASDHVRHAAVSRHGRLGAKAASR